MAMSEPTGECEKCRTFFLQGCGVGLAGTDLEHAVMHLLDHRYRYDKPLDLGHQARPVEHRGDLEYIAGVCDNLLWIGSRQVEENNAEHMLYFLKNDVLPGVEGIRRIVRKQLGWPANPQASEPAAQSPAEKSPALRQARQMRIAYSQGAPYSNEPWFALEDLILAREKEHKYEVESYRRWIDNKIKRTDQLCDQVEQLQRDLAASISVLAYDEAITERDAARQEIEQLKQLHVESTATGEAYWTAQTEKARQALRELIAELSVRSIFQGARDFDHVAARIKEACDKAEKEGGLRSE